MDEEIALLKKRLEMVVAERNVSHVLWPAVAEQVLALIAENARLKAELADARGVLALYRDAQADARREMPG